MNYQAGFGSFKFKLYFCPPMTRKEYNTTISTERGICRTLLFGIISNSLTTTTGTSTGTTTGTPWGVE